MLSASLNKTSLSLSLSDGWIYVVDRCIGECDGECGDTSIGDG